MNTPNINAYDQGEAGQPKAGTVNASTLPRITINEGGKGTVALLVKQVSPNTVLTINAVFWAIVVGYIHTTKTSYYRLMMVEGDGNGSFKTRPTGALADKTFSTPQAAFDFLDLS